MSDDLVKRSDAMQVALWFGTSELKYSRQFVKKRVMEIPIAEPKQGEWIRTSNDWIDGTCGARYYPIHCSICNYSTYDDSATNFCPNCGARMKGADDEVR